VHHAVIHHHLRAKHMPDALVTEADAKHGHFLPERADDLVRQSRFARRAWSRRHENALRLQRSDLVERDLIVAPHLQFHLQLAEILHEVVGERIVIVYDQNHCGDKLAWSAILEIRK